MLKQIKLANKPHKCLTFPYFQVQLRCPTAAGAALLQQLPVAVAGALANRVAPKPSVPKATKSYRKRKEREAVSGLRCKRNKPRT